jgi:hypothetical protein
VLAKDKITGPKMKASNPLTTKPGTNRDANQKHKPLTTSENSPNVRKLIGRDRTERTGRIAELTNPTATAANKAAGKLAMFTPGTTRSTTNNPNAVAKVVTRYPMMLVFILIWQLIENSDGFILDLVVWIFALFGDCPDCVDAARYPA